MSEIRETLSQRDMEYGDFPRQAAVAQSLKKAMRAGANWRDMKDEQRDALEMIAVKISRILNGNPDNFDSWHDIEGYAKLVADRLEQ